MSFLKNIIKSASFLLIINFTSCTHENVVISEYVDIINSNFSYLDTISFEVAIDDTVSNHNVFLQLRTSTNYKWSNMFVFSDIDFPNGKTRTDTFQVFITDKTGHWMGNKSGLIVNFNHSLYSNIKFPVAGDYKFSFNQAMRDTVLKDVMSLGLKITKNSKEN
jgi:gliding motility-associated lipoprotein GldH